MNDAPPTGTASSLGRAAAVIAIVLGAINALRFVGYVCDDAVISFRSVQNFALGHGWVFNVGERVETFTNLGLVWLLTAAQALGCDLFAVAGWVGWAAAVAALLGTWLLARELLPPNAAWAPVLALGASTTLMGQAGNGLETTTCAAFLTFGLWRVLAECRPPAAGAKPALPGLGLLLLGIAAVVRIDAVLVLGGAFVLKLWRSDAPRDRRAVSIDTVVLLAGLAGPTLFRWLYYGDPVPNPVRAKFAMTPDPTIYKTGLTYVLEWLRTDIGAPVLVAGLLLALSTGRRACMLVVLCAGWLLYVVSSGGDHMPYFRFVAPMLPALLVVTFAGAHRLAASGGLLTNRAGAAIAALFVLALAAEPAVQSVSRGNVPERNFANEEYRREVGEFFAAEAKRRGAPLVIAAGGAGYTAYFAGPTVRFVDLYGLTNSHVAVYGRRDARLPPGHQAGDGQYVLSQKPAFIVMGSSTPNDKWQQDDAAAMLARIVAAGVEAWEQQHDQRFSVSDRELLQSREFHRDYEFATEQLGSGRPFRVFRRRA